MDGQVFVEIGVSRTSREIMQTGWKTLSYVSYVIMRPIR